MFYIYNVRQQVSGLWSILLVLWCSAQSASGPGLLVSTHPHTYTSIPMRFATRAIAWNVEKQKVNLYRLKIRGLWPLWNGWHRVSCYSRAHRTRDSSGLEWPTDIYWFPYTVFLLFKKIQVSSAFDRWPPWLEWLIGQQLMSALTHFGRCTT